MKSIYTAPVAELLYLSTEDILSVSNGEYAEWDDANP